MSAEILDELYKILVARRRADPEESYVASLYEQGTEKIAQKIQEEAKETIVEAFSGNPQRLAEESADLIFHLMVLWAYQDIKAEDVFAVLEKRFGTSGHDEKAGRPSKA